MIHWKRLVAQGYLQAEGFDVTETFAPTVRLITIRLVLGFATHRGWKIFQMDVKSAFLNGKIKEEFYVAQAPGFELPNSKDKVRKLKKALYGLKQTPRAWYQTIDSFFTSQVSLMQIYNRKWDICNNCIIRK